MKKAVALSAVLVLFALIGCTPKKTAPIDINTLPVTPIEYLMNVKYGPGSQALEMTMKIVINEEEFEAVMDVDSVITRLGENLLHRYQVRNLRMRDGLTKTNIKGPVFESVLLSEVTGKILTQDISSDVLNQTQLEEMKKNMDSMFASALVNTSVKTGTVMFSAQDALRDKLPAGYSLDNMVVNNILAGYVMYNGEKALLVKCDQQEGQFRQDATGIVADFRLVSNTVLRPENLQPIHAESSVTIYFAEPGLTVKIEGVLREK